MIVEHKDHGLLGLTKFQVGTLRLGKHPYLSWAMPPPHPLPKQTPFSEISFFKSTTPTKPALTHQSEQTDTNTHQHQHFNNISSTMHSGDWPAVFGMVFCFTALLALLLIGLWCCCRGRAQARRNVTTLNHARRRKELSIFAELYDNIDSNAQNAAARARSQQLANLRQERALLDRHCDDIRQQEAVAWVLRNGARGYAVPHHDSELGYPPPAYARNW